LWITGQAATHPWTYVVAVITISLVLVVTGLFTNFNVDVDEDTLWTPRNSRPLSHGKWIDDVSGFKAAPRYFQALIHRNGDNVLGMDGVRRSFEVLDVIRTSKGYDELCLQADHVNFQGVPTCPVYSITNFWNDTQVVFESGISTDDEAIVAMSADAYPNGAPVEVGLIMGRAIVGDDGILVSAESFVISVALPDENDAEDVEKVALDALLDVQDAWFADEGNDFVLQVFATRSFSDEFTRAIVNDIPLVPIVFVSDSAQVCAKNSYSLYR